MKSRIFIFLLSLLTLLFACQETAVEQHLVGVWVGSYQGNSEKVPFPAIFQFLPDSSYRVVFEGKEEKGKWKLTGNLLQMEDSSWHAYFRQGGKLNMKRSGKKLSDYRVFRRAEKNSQLYSLQESQQKLSSLRWTNIHEIPKYGFCRQDIHTYRNDSLLIHRRYFCNQDSLEHEEMESFCYELVETTASQFILFSNGAACSKRLAPRQILQLNDNQLALLSYYHNEKKYPKDEALHHLFYLALPDSLNHPAPASESAVIFSPCKDEKGAYEDGYVRLENPDSLRKFFHKNFRDFPNSQSGRIEIYLTVDCQGQAGKINLVQMDQKRHATYFASPIVKQLFEMTARYPFSANPESGNDSQRKLTFEIAEGRLVEVKVDWNL